jgi:hypothetical protein
MGRRRSSALRDTAGVYHVASRLAHEGFHATVARGTGTDVLAGLPGAPGTTALAVRTTECPTGFGGEGRVCEWRMGKGAALADDPGLFVALVDLKRGGLPRVWIVPSAKVRARFALLKDPKPWRYRASAEELAPHDEDWDAVEDHLRRQSARRTAWFDKGELREIYGDEFVEALEAEASRLLGAHNSITRRMADAHFPAEDLAEASALRTVLFRRWAARERERRRKEGSGGA